VSTGNDDALRRVMRDPVFSSPVRLGIMLYLIPRGEAYFTELQEALKLTPGNLGSHLRKLREAGYVRILRYLEDRPRTVVKVTDIGIRKTLEYVNKLIDAAEDVLRTYGENT